MWFFLVLLRTDYCQWRVHSMHPPLNARHIFYLFTCIKYTFNCNHFITPHNVSLNTPSTAIISQYRCSYGVPTVCVPVREYVQSLLICTVSQVAKSRNMQSLAICKLIYKVLQSAKSLKLRSCLGCRCGASCACLFLFCVVARCNFFDVEQQQDT